MYALGSFLWFVAFQVYFRIYTLFALRRPFVILTGVYSLLPILRLHSGAGDGRRAEEELDRTQGAWESDQDGETNETPEIKKGNPETGETTDNIHDTKIWSQNDKVFNCLQVCVCMCVVCVCARVCVSACPP